jgi:hypothetical protein
VRPARAHSPVNVLLDRMPRALEARGCGFARCAHDCNACVGGVKAGRWLMAYLTRLYSEPQVRINVVRSTVGSAVGRKSPVHGLQARPSFQASQTGMGWPATGPRGRGPRPGVR